MAKRLRALLFLVSISLLATNARSRAGSPGIVNSLVVPPLPLLSTVPGIHWWMGHQVMNVGAGNAVFVSWVGPTYPYAELNDQGWAQNIAPGAAYTFLPTDFPYMDNGSNIDVFGPASIQSDQPIRGILNVTNRLFAPYGGTAGGKAITQYRGIDAAGTGTTLYAPIAKKAYPTSNPKTNLFYIENVSGVATHVQSTYTCNGQPYSIEMTGLIGPGGRAGMSPANVPDIQNGSNCSASFASTDPSGQLLAGVSYEFYTTEPPPLKSLMATRLLTDRDASGSLLAPVYKYKFLEPGMNIQVAQRSTGMQITNVGASYTNIEADYYYYSQPGLGSCVGGSYIDTWTGANTAPGESRTFFEPPLPVNCLASARFVASNKGKIVGVENESYLYPVPSFDNQSATATNLIARDEVTSKVVLPIYKEFFGTKSSALYVQNASATSQASYTVRFRSGANTWTIVNQSLNPLEMRRYYRVNRDSSLPWAGGALPEDSNTAVTIEATGPIAAVIIEVTLDLNDPLDPNHIHPCFEGSTCFDQQSSEGFNVLP